MPHEMGQTVVVSVDQLRGILEGIFNEPDAQGPVTIPPALSALATDEGPAKLGPKSFDVAVIPPATPAVSTDEGPAKAGPKSFNVAVIPPAMPAVSTDEGPAKAGPKSFDLADTTANRTDISTPRDQYDRYAWDNVPFEDIDWSELSSAIVMKYMFMTCHWELKRRNCNKNTCQARYHLCRDYVS